MAWWNELTEPVAGRYRLDGLLGEGGMAYVFRATDLRAQRQVALKTPRLESFPPDRVQELLARFRREFKAQAEDPIHGVVPVYEAGEFSDAAGVQRPYLAMQFMSGGSLASRLGGGIGQREHRQVLAEVLDWLAPIARTIDRLHSRGYLHRDVKPDNILFNSDDDPFLADFGVVGVLDSGNALSGSTLGPSALGSPGSPGYQSPESIRADSLARMASASDQFSLAITVYEALAGLLPVQVGSHAEWYAALVHWRPAPLSTHLPNIPAGPEAVVMKALSADARERYISCTAFAQALTEAVHQARIAPPPAPRPAAPAPPASPQPVPAPLWRDAADTAPAGAAHASPPAASDTAGAQDKPAQAWRRFLLPAVLLVSALLFALFKAGFFDGADAEQKVQPSPHQDAVPPKPEPEPIDDHKTSPAPIDDTTPLKPEPEPACASQDADADGVNDCSDRCVETPAGRPVDAKGCFVLSDFSSSTVFLSATNTSLPAPATEWLDAVAVAMREHPELRYEVVGHARATEEGAQAMSQLRAQVVYAYLLSRGVEASRLAGPTGVGSTQPYAPASDETGAPTDVRVSLNRLQ